MRPALVPILLADPLPWAKRAEYAWDFLRDRARFAGGYKGALANTPNWTFTRASTGYAQTAAGVLVPFASGELRRTDKGVLIEGARTNLCLQSADFATTWTNSATTETVNATTAPDGTLTADKIEEDNTTAAHEMRQSITITSGIAHTFSVYIKPAERTWAVLYDSATANVAAWFNLSGAGSVGTRQASNTAATITALANGWYRCAITYTSGATGASYRIVTATGDAAFSFAGTTGSGFYVWGAQVEAAAFPSSYIPTTTASATRAADVLSVPVSGLTYPISLFCEFERAVDTGAVEAWFAHNAGGTERVEMVTDTSDRASVFQVAGGVLVAAPNVTGALAVGTVYKVAARVGLNSVQIARGGTLGTEDTSAAAPTTPTTITFGERNGANDFCFGYLRRAAIYSRALTDAELQAVTT